MIEHQDEGECSCSVGPKQTRFDPACPYHGDDGNMVGEIHLPNHDE